MHGGETTRGPRAKGAAAAERTGDGAARHTRPGRGRCERARSVGAAWLALSLGGGCGASAATVGPDGGPGGGDGGTADSGTPAAHLPVDTAPLSFAGWRLPPGEDDTRCLDLRLGNAEKLNVVAMHTKLSLGSHHFIVYKTSTTEERTTPYKCDPFVDTLKGDSTPLLITQIDEETVQLPDGIALELEPNQMIHLEGHFINLDERQDILAEAEVRFTHVPDAAVRARAGFMFYGDADINLPPNTSRTVGPTYIEVPAGTNVYAMTGHTHALGTNVRIEKSAGKAGVGEPLYNYEEWSWDNPPTRRYEPPITFAEGEGLRFACDYTNDTARTVRFGESAKSEMCFLWAYYWPSEGHRLCAVLDGISVCCPGDILCDLIRGAF